MDDSTDARAREIAAGLTELQADALRHDNVSHAHPRTRHALYMAGLVTYQWCRTDLGRAVTRVLASQEVDRG